MKKGIVTALLCALMGAEVICGYAPTASAQTNFVDPVTAHGKNYWENRYLEKLEKSGKESPSHLAIVAFGLKGYETAKKYFAKIESPTAHDYMIQAMNSAESGPENIEEANEYLAKLKTMESDESMLYFTEGFLSEMSFRNTHSEKDFLAAVDNYAKSDALKNATMGNNRLVRLMEDNKGLRKLLPKNSDAIRLWKEGRKHREDSLYEKRPTDPVKEIRRDAETRYLHWYQTKTSNAIMY